MCIMKLKYCNFLGQSYCLIGKDNLFFPSLSTDWLQ
jgi:hypothetical protein